MLHVHARPCLHVASMHAHVVQNSCLHLKAAREAAGWLLQSAPWRAGDETMVGAAAAAALYTKCVAPADA